MEVSVQFPCKKYVAHYLQQTYGVSPRMTRGSHHGLQFLNLLDRKVSRYDNRITDSEFVLDMKIPYYEFEVFGSNLSLTSANIFNKIIEDHLKELFMVHMHALVKLAGFQTHAAIRLFQQEYGFHDDVWDFRALKKHYQRHCNDEKALKAA